MTKQFLPSRHNILALATLAVLSAAASWPAPAQEKPAAASPAPAASSKEAAQYCTNIANAAADARYAWQKETLLNLEKELEDRIKTLEAKRAEYEAWLKKRNDFLDRADETVVAIYTRMKPDAAAQQLANMNEGTAAAILMKLSARNASAVLNEMEPARAAQLTSIITDAAKRTQDNEKSG